MFKKRSKRTRENCVRKHITKTSLGYIAPDCNNLEKTTILGSPNTIYCQVYIMTTGTFIWLDEQCILRGGSARPTGNVCFGPRKTRSRLEHLLGTG